MRFGKPPSTLLKRLEERRQADDDAEVSEGAPAPVGAAQAPASPEGGTVESPRARAPESAAEPPSAPSPPAAALDLSSDVARALRLRPALLAELPLPARLDFRLTARPLVCVWTTSRRLYEGRDAPDWVPFVFGPAEYLLLIEGALRGVVGPEEMAQIVVRKMEAPQVRLGAAEVFGTAIETLWPTAAPTAGRWVSAAGRGWYERGTLGEACDLLGLELDAVRALPKAPSAA